MVARHPEDRDTGAQDRSAGVAQERDGAPGHALSGGSAAKKGPSLARRLARSLGRVAGWSQGADFVRSLPLGRPFRHIALVRRRLRDNLALEDEALGRDFARVLRLWQLREEDLGAYLQARTREAWAAGVLSLLAACACFANLLWPARSPLVRLLADFAAASFFAASLLMCLAAAWRVSVCRRRRFVPFTTWLVRLFLPDRADRP